MNGDADRNGEAEVRSPAPVTKGSLASCLSHADIPVGLSQAEILIETLPARRYGRRVGLVGNRWLAGFHPPPSHPFTHPRV